MSTKHHRKRQNHKQANSKTKNKSNLQRGVRGQQLLLHKRDDVFVQHSARLQVSKSAPRDEIFSSCLRIIHISAVTFVPSSAEYLRSLHKFQTKSGTRDDCASAVTLGTGRIRRRVVKEGLANHFRICEMPFFGDVEQDAVSLGTEHDGIVRQQEGEVDPVIVILVAVVMNVIVVIPASDRRGIQRSW